MKALLFIIPILVLPLLVKSGFFTTIMSLLFINSLAAMGLNLIMGYAGQISIGQAAFMGIGAYTSSLLTMKLSLPLPLSILCGTLLAAFLGLFLGFPSLRLSGFYLAIVTLGFGVAVEQVLGAWEELTGGYIGIRNIPSFGNDLLNYYVVSITFFIILLVVMNLTKGRTGRAWRSLRENETASRVFGINLTKYKVLAFVLGSALAGLAGAFYAHVIGYISPTDFGLARSLDLLAMVVIGGLGTTSGSILGASLYTVLPFMLSRTQFSLSVLFGSLLVLTILFMPRGLAYYAKIFYYKYLEIPFVWWERRKKKIEGKVLHTSSGLVHYVEKGSGTIPLVFVHGNWGSWRWFKPFFDIVEDSRYRLIAVDLPGFGFSDKPKRPINLENYAKELEEILDKLNLKECVLIGHSMGTSITTKLASRRSDLAKKLVFISPSPIKGYRTPKESFPLLSLYKNSFSLVENLVYPIIKDRKLARELVKDALRMDPRGFLENPKALSEDLTEEARKINVPVLLIWGNKDPLVTKAEVEETAKAFKKFHLVILDSFGHCPHIDDPERVFKIIEDFIRGGVVNAFCQDSFNGDLRSREDHD